MSDVSGKITRGKGTKKVTLKVKDTPRLNRAQWAEFKEKLKALAKQYGVEFVIE
jgi:transposase